MKKYFFPYLFGLTFLLLSFLPQFYELSLSHNLPADRALVAGEHIFTYDYNVYLSKIRQGQEGRWLVVNKYDNHPEQQGVLLQMFYLVSGKLTALINLSPPITYHLLRLVTGFFWIITIIFINFYFLKTTGWAVLGVIVSLLAASLPRFVRIEGQWWIGPYMDWWQELDVIKRISFIPHDVLNYIFTASFIAMIPRLSSINWKKFLIFTCLLCLSVFIHPAAALLFFGAWIIYAFFHLFFFKPINHWQLTIARLIVSAFFIIAPLLYIKSVTANYPWKSLIDFEQRYRLIVPFKEYIFALGSVFFTGAVGGLLVVIKKDSKLLPLVCWLLAAFAAIAVFTFLPFQSPLRFVQTANHLPLAILTIYLFKQLNTAKFSKNYPAPTATILKLFSGVIISLIIFLGLAQSYFSLKGQLLFIRQKIFAGFPLVPAPPQAVYPLTDFYQAINWLEKNSRPQQVVLSKYTAGNYIPAYSGNFVYLGHAETPQYELREQSVNGFFSGAMGEDASYRFLKSENISYVFYGPQEKEINTNQQLTISKYQFLKPVFQSAQVTIFEVRS